MVPPTPVVNGCVHLAFFYRGRPDYLGATIPFILDGLHAGEPVAVAVPGPRLELLRTELAANVAGVELIDMAQRGRNPGRIIPAVLKPFVDAHAGRPVRIVGEPVWTGRTRLEYPACAQHEARVNLAFAGHSVSLLCPYDATRLAPLVLSDVGRTHPRLGSARRGWYDSFGYDPEGILDDYNRPLPAPHVPVATFDFVRSCLAKARRFAAEKVGEAGLPDERIADARQVVGELAANSIVHGGGQGTLRVWSESGHAVCETSDAGFIDDPLAGYLPVGNTDLHGRGLLLVNLLSDLVRTHTTEAGTTTRVYFALPAA
jgi:anti-sigma regulatory factor (Ser/Thr protein kinase)